MQDCQVKNIYEGFPASHAANKLLTCSMALHPDAPLLRHQYGCDA